MRGAAHAADCEGEWVNFAECDPDPDCCSGVCVAPTILQQFRVTQEAVGLGRVCEANPTTNQPYEEFDQRTFSCPMPPTCEVHVPVNCTYHFTPWNEDGCNPANPCDNGNFDSSRTAVHTVHIDQEREYGGQCPYSGSLEVESIRCSQLAVCKRTFPTRTEMGLHCGTLNSHSVTAENVMAEVAAERPCVPPPPPPPPPEPEPEPEPAVVPPECVSAARCQLVDKGSSSWPDWPRCQNSDSGPYAICHQTDLTSDSQPCETAGGACEAQAVAVPVDVHYISQNTRCVVQFGCKILAC